MQTETGQDEERLQSARRLLTVVYALQAASFLTAITLVVGAVIDYVKRDEVRGTWLESHVRWQIRTFWWTVLWTLLGGLTAEIGIGLVILFATAVWFIYRIVKGWLKLSDGKAMYS